MRKYMTIEEYCRLPLKNKKKNRKKCGLLVMEILCGSIIIFSLSIISYWHLENSKIRQIKKEISTQVELQESKTQGKLIHPPKDKNSNYYYYVRFPFYGVNFSLLESKNADTVGFIRLRHTDINYPVVQGVDNKYYLKHSFYQEENNAGWVFMDYRSRNDFSGDNTVVYGHARGNGSMFGTLKNVLTKDWQKDRDNYVIFFSSPKENMVFQIFSIYTTKSDGYYILPNFFDEEKKQKWIDTMLSRNIAPIDTEVSVEDHFLTLSTCWNDDGGRVVVHAKLIKKQKNKQNQ